MTELLPMVFTSGWASGVNAYATVLVLGLIGRIGGVESIPEGLQRTDVLVAAAVLYALDDTHLLVSRSTAHEWNATQQILLYDLTTKTSTEIAVLPRGHSYHAYDRETGVVAL